MDYLQVDTASAFSGKTTINSLTFYYSNYGGNSDILGGSYQFYWGYAGFGTINNLSSNLSSNYIGGPNLVGSNLSPPVARPITVRSPWLRRRSPTTRARVIS